MDEPSQINLGPRAVTASLLLILERFVGSKSQGWAVSLLRENTHLQLFRMTFTTSRCSYDDVLGFRHVNYCSSYQTLYLHIHILNIAPRKKKHRVTRTTPGPFPSPGLPACVARVVDPRLAIHSTATTSQASPGLSQAVFWFAQPGSLRKQIWWLMGSFMVYIYILIWIYLVVYFSLTKYFNKYIYIYSLILFAGLCAKIFSSALVVQD